MYLRAKYTKYKMAKTKFSIWRYVICEICKKNGSNRPFLASRVADTIFPPLIEGHHRQLDNQCRDPMNNNKDCRVGQLTSLQDPCEPTKIFVFKCYTFVSVLEVWNRFPSKVLSAKDFAAHFFHFDQHSIIMANGHYHHSSA